MGTRTSFSFYKCSTKVLGDEKSVIGHVDDIVIHNSELDDHLATLVSVLHILTSAGFNINASKFQFDRPEIKLLGYIICDSTLRPDTIRIEAILSYPPPKNRKEFRNFLAYASSTSSSL
jgi:hypothetical protein